MLFFFNYFCLATVSLWGFKQFAHIWVDSCVIYKTGGCFLNVWERTKKRKEKETYFLLQPICYSDSTINSFVLDSIFQFSNQTCEKSSNFGLNYKSTQRLHPYTFPDFYPWFSWTFRIAFLNLTCQIWQKRGNGNCDDGWPFLDLLLFLD